MAEHAKTIAELDRNFQSGNDVPVERSLIYREEWEMVRTELASLRTQVQQKDEEIERLKYYEGMWLLDADPRKELVVVEAQLQQRDTETTKLYQVIQHANLIITKLEARLAAAIELLRRLQWTADIKDRAKSNPHPRYCPDCGHEQMTDHSPVCELQTLLADPANAEVVQHYKKAKRVLSILENTDKFVQLSNENVGNPWRMRQALLADEPAGGDDAH